MIPVSKITDFFLGFKRRYDAQVIRNEKMDEFLASAKTNFDKIGEMNNTMADLGTTVASLETKVDNLQTHIGQLDDRLDTIGRGTKMELLETLYRWRKILVERGWRTKEEMKEIKDIYELYHKKLEGNG